MDFNSSPAEKKIWELSLNWFLQWNICRNCVFLYAMKRWTHQRWNIISTDESHRNCIHKWILHVEDRNCRLANSLVEVWFCFRRRTFGKNILLQNIEENILPSGLSNKNLHYTQTHTHTPCYRLNLVPQSHFSPTELPSVSCMWSLAWLKRHVFTPRNNNPPPKGGIGVITLSVNSGASSTSRWWRSGSSSWEVSWSTRASFMWKGRYMQE